MKNIILIVLTCIFLLQNIEDASGSVFIRTSNEVPDTSGVLQDWMGRPYKRHIPNSLKTQIKSTQNDVWIEVDTTITIDTRNRKINIANASIDTLFIAYYQKFITPPKHCGDPNEAKLSFVVNGLGQVIAIHVLENVRNACSADWIIHIEPSYIFVPLNINDSSFSAEYIVTMTDVSYCLCETIEKGERKKKRRGQ